MTFAADAGDGTTGALEAVQQIASADLYPTDTPNEYEFRITPESGDHRFVLVSNVENLGQPDGIAIGDNIWAPSNLDTYQTFAAAETDYGRMYQFGSATMPAASMVAWPGNVNPADISASNPGIRWSDGEDVAAFNYPAAWSSSGGWITANNPCPPGLDDPNSGAVAEPGRQHDKRRRE